MLAKMGMMHLGSRRVLAVLAFATALSCSRLFCHQPSEAREFDHQAYRVPQSIAEARDRARLLHEMVHGALQVVHRDFFDEENIHTIPSRSLEDVFVELERSFGVTVRWIAFNAKAMNVDHKPRDDFEKTAADALKAGKSEFESCQPGEGRYRHIGSIRLASQCLKCHLPTRSSNEDRLAGLSITMKVDVDRGLTAAGKE